MANLPQLSATKWAVYGLGAVLALCLAGVVVYRLFFQGQDLAREHGARVVAEEQSAAEGSIVDGTMGALHERDAYREHVTTVVRDGTREIENVWTGETVGDGVDRAGAAALCRLHDSLCRPDGSAPVQPVR